MPAPLVAQLHRELVRILEQPDVRERIAADGSEPLSSSPAEFRDFMAADLAKWARVVKQSGAKFE
jgi:tripartite-type tricarboxylate transporter receptor subunit TctC